MSTILKRSSFNLSQIATETIDFQTGDKFGPQIEAIVASLITKINNETYKDNNSIKTSQEIKDLIKLIYDRLGLKVKIITNELSAAIFPFYSNKHLVLLNPFLRGNFEEDTTDALLLNSNEKKGYVDTKRTKVGGIFSEYENILYLNFKDFIAHKLTPAEITAVILHELGHGFYACEYSNRLESSNQILQDIAGIITSEKREKNAEYVYKELKKINDDILEEEVDKMLSGDNVIPGYYWFKNIIGTVKTQSKYVKYDETSFEQLADNFAARFGYGRAIVTALDKISFKHSGLFFFLTNLNQTSLLVVTAAGLMVLPWVGLYLLILSNAIIFLSGEGANDYTYDELKIRYQRIRNEQTALLKQVNLSVKDTKYVLDSIKLMDEIIDKTATYRTLFNKLANLTIPFHRKVNKDIKEQQLLELLANNDLFVKSAQLKVLSKT